MKRLLDEDFRAYKERQKKYGKALKRYLNGWLIWNNGTYIKSQHGAIGYNEGRGVNAPRCKRWMAIAASLLISLLTLFINFLRRND